MSSKTKSKTKSKPKANGKPPFTIASFDIGLKNLAFCVMQRGEKSDVYNIIEWKNINLTIKNDTGLEDKICESIIQSGARKGQQCGSGAKIEDDKGNVYCNRHNPDKEKYKPRKQRKVNSISLKEMCCTLANRLDVYHDLFGKVDHVIIETQFTRNRKMICLSDMLYSYFILRGVLVEEERIKEVKFVSARNKLKVYNGPFVESKLKNAKAKRKQLAIKYCEWMIRGDKERLEEFNKFPRKKDDLSDCFLQGCWYLKMGPGKRL
jgi:hypothetical protein